MLKPLGDRIVIKVIEDTEQTSGGIFIPDSAKEKPQKGEVVAVGQGKMNEKGERDILIEEHSYGEIKMWFLGTYPEIEKFNEETNKKLREIKAKRAEARKAA